MVRPCATAAGLLGLLGLTACGGTVPTPQAAAPSQSTAAPQAAPLLQASAVQALYATGHREDGEVLSGAHAGKHWIKWVSADGELRLSAAHGMFRDNGHFRVEGNQVCTTWQEIDKGKTACMRLSKVAPDLYVTLDRNGQAASRFRVTVPGEPPGPME